MIFYDTDGKMQLRLVGYQSPDKFRGTLDYLETGQQSRMRFSDFLQQRKSSPVSRHSQATGLNLDRRKANDRPLLVVFETAGCGKCQQLQTMLKAPIMKPYTQWLDIVYLSNADMTSRLTRPDGR